MKPILTAAILAASAIGLVGAAGLGPHAQAAMMWIHTQTRYAALMIVQGARRRFRSRHSRPCARSQGPKS